MNRKRKDVMEATAPARVYPGPGYQAATVEDEQPKEREASFIERALHGAGYIEMSSLPPRKFFSWSNIGNIMTILTAMAALAWFLWTTAVDVGVNRERNRQNEERLLTQDSEIKQLQKLVLDSGDKEDPPPTPTKKEKK